MLVASEIRHESLPDDDVRRVVYWAGLISSPSSDMHTRRFSLWLQAVDEHGQAKAAEPLIRVVESLGSISRYPIGSVWQKQKSVGALPRDAQELTIVVPKKWEIVRAGDSRTDFQDRRHVAKLDLDLTFSPSAIEPVRAYNAHMVVADTTDGRRLLIPCYEIYRAFYAATSDLALGLARSPWGEVSKQLIDGRSRGRIGDAEHWHLDLAPGVPRSAAKQLAWLEFGQGASRAADVTHYALLRQAQTGEDRWISARPPVSIGSLRLRVLTRRLPRSNATLVTQILDFAPEVNVSKFTCTVAEQTFVGADEKEREPVETNQRVKRVAKAILPPSDRRNSAKRFVIPGQPTGFASLPEPEFSPRRFRSVPRTAGIEGTPEILHTAVSVGASGRATDARPGVVSSGNSVPLSERFRGVVAALKSLERSGQITSWGCPVIASNGIWPIEGDVKCNPRSWARVEGRPREALLLKIAIGDRTIYWFDIEPMPRGYRALAFEFLQDELDTGTMRAITDVVMKHVGVWPNPPMFGEKRMVATTARHLLQDNAVAESVFLTAFERLSKLALSKCNEQLDQVGL